MSIGRRPRTSSRLTPWHRGAAVLIAVALVSAIDVTPAISARIDHGEHRSVAAWRFASVVETPEPDAPWPVVVDALRRAGGSHSVIQSPSGAHFAHHAARCLANNPDLENPHHVPLDHRCGMGVDRSSARIGAANSTISMRSTRHTPRQVLEGLVGRPFHSMAFLDPALNVIDYASAYRPTSTDTDRRFVAATWLSSVGTTVEHPAMSVLMWPAPGWPVRGEFTAGEEWPNPLWPCGLEVSGSPIWIAVPSLGRAPRLDEVRLVGAGAGADADDLCIYTAEGFTGDDDEAVAIGRHTMERLSAVIIVPRSPLGDGEYRLIGRLEGRPFERSITVGTAP